MYLPEDYKDIHGWCSIEKANKMMEVVTKCNPKLILELGVFGGRSLLALAIASKNVNNTSKVIGVDAWNKLSALEGINDNANNEWWSKIDYDMMYNYTIELMKKHNVDNIVELWKSKSCDVANKFLINSIDIIHQDSNHSEETSTNEVELYWDKVIPGGYWIFDDTNWETTQRAQHLLESKGYTEIYAADKNEWKIYERQIGISFIYSTMRTDPKFEWFIDSLYNQANEINFDIKNIQIIIVDYELQYNDARINMFKNIINNRFEYIHVPPKPCSYQGLHKLTKQNYFCASIARNTGVVYTKFSYLAFIDDLSVMGNHSFKHIVNCAKQNIVCAFAYRKVYDLIVENGYIYNRRETEDGMDHREKQMFENQNDIKKISGYQLYGYAASPLEIILKVNGYDEICNSIGYEDFHYGVRCEKLCPIYYCNKVLFFEMYDTDCNFIRRNPILDACHYEKLLKKYNITRRVVPDGTTDLSNLILDLSTRDKYISVGNNYNLENIRITKDYSWNFLDDKTTTSIDGISLYDL